MKLTARKRILAVIFAVVALVGVLAAPLAAQAKTGWVKEDGQWYCYDENGNIIRNGWAEYQGKYYWMGPTCTAYASMWVKDNGSWYHLGSSGARDVNKWVKGVKAEGALFGLDCDGGYFYVGSDARMVTDGWAKTGMGYYCFGSDGRPLIDRWVLNEGKWYHLGSSGKLNLNEWIAGVHTEGLPWSYSDTDGWFHVNARGWLETNTWVRYGKYYCYVGSDGKTVSNQWVPYEGNWYHFSNNYIPDVNKKIYGNPEEGRLFGFNCWYDDIFFVDSYGRLRASQTIEWDGYLYFVDTDGKAVKNRWLQGLYYADAEGHLVREGVVEISPDEWYYFDDYHPVWNTWRPGLYGGENYYGSDGRAVRNSIVPGGDTYRYVDEYGFYVRNREIDWEGAQYYFDSSGDMVFDYLSSDFHYYYSDGKRIILTGWFHCRGNRIYLRDGVALHGGTYEVDGWYCKFDSNGFLVDSEPIPVM